MPIYVNGGEAGKLYMMSDPPLQIGKVYRKDAGGSSLILSSEVVLQGGSVSWNYLDTSTHTYTFCTWDLQGAASVAFTITGSSYCVADSRVLNFELLFADGTVNRFAEWNSTGTYNGGSYTVNLSGYTDAQKASVIVRCNTRISYGTPTNRYNYGNLSIESAIAS